MSARLGTRDELSEEARLADPGLAHDSDLGSLASVKLGQRTLEQREFVGTSNELPGNHDRSSPVPPGPSPANVDEERASGSGCAPDVGTSVSAQAEPMARYVLHHQHRAHDCRAAFTAFKGHGSPLRHRSTVASCWSGGHEIWWTVDAESATDALAQLPRYVADRTTATRVDDVEIP
jgi:hypothetical protein